MTIIITLTRKILSGWHLHNNVPTGRKKIHCISFSPLFCLCSPSLLYLCKFSQTVHLLQRVSLATTHSMENKCKDFFFFPFHTFLWDSLLMPVWSKQRKICQVLWWFDTFPRLFLDSFKKKKFPRGPWPLNVRRRVSFPLLRREAHLLFTGCSMWRVQEGVASERKLLNKAFEYWIWDGFHCSRHSYGFFFGGGLFFFFSGGLFTSEQF